ncbi:MAG: hypothetical protein WCK41_09535 [Actinomycetes bacterium]|jgi:hypothetical protein
MARTKATLWRGYRRPILRDGVLWFAVLLGVCGTMIQSPFSGWTGSVNDWLILLLQFTVTLCAALILVGVIAATVRGFGQGWRTAETDPSTATQETTLPIDRPAHLDKAERHVRAFGRAFGAARRTYRDSD